MRSITIELSRFGKPADKVLNMSDKYLRAIGNEPQVEVGSGLMQKPFRLQMKRLQYERLRQGSLEERRQEAEDALKGLIEPIKDILAVPDSTSEELRQVDVVTSALELAQLPIEVLEEESSNIVLTRRVRQEWPRPPIVVKPSPKVLFVWAEPLRKNSTTRRQTVPHDVHRELLHQALADWLESQKPEKTLVEIGNATFDQIRIALQNPDHGFTHVHILAHGRFDDFSEEVFLLLEDDEGKGSSHSLEELKSIYEDKELPRPGTVVLATCHSGEVDPLDAGGTLGQVLHETGVPVVLASQLALTQPGSSELIKEFFARVVVGEDPRRALRACRDALRRRQDETYYDRVALVGYIHLPEDFDAKLPELKLKIALARLEAASKSAANAATPEEKQVRFGSVRDQLDELHRSGNVSEGLLEELLGLRASSLKREAEAFWDASRDASPSKKKEYLEICRNALRDARIAYGEAAVLSRDNHWTIVQSLVLDAVVDGSIIDRKWDWISACQASRDAAERSAKPLDRLWGLGSISELHILAPLVGEEIDFTGEQVATLLEISKAEGGWPLEVSARQLDRYLKWWGEDDVWKLTDEVLQRARAVRDALSVTRPVN